MIPSLTPPSLTPYHYLSDYRIQRPGMAMGLLACFFIFMLVVASVLFPLLMRVISRPEAAVRIATVLQDILIFILPTLGTALLVSRLPARVIAADRGVELWPCMLTVMVMICAIPALNWLIIWNQGWHLPDSVSSVEQTLRQMEDSASETVKILFAGHSAGTLVIGILIVGVLAGFSEELFFRGGILRLVGMTRLNPHVAIWLVALIFSVFHFQMFGLVPRMLLGALFGYLLWWSQSLWLPVLAHVFNNSLVVVVQWNAEQGRAVPGIDLDRIGSDLSSAAGITALCLSVVLTLFWLMMLRRYYAKNASK